VGKSLRSEVRVFTDLTIASHSLAEMIVEEADKAVEKRGRFALALSGGKTPRILYNLLASEYSSRMDWAAAHLFWGDERWVPKDHPDSNFAMAYDTLVSKIPIPPQNIHRIPVEMETPERAADSYDKTLRAFFKEREEEISYTFDVTLLGVGKEGHTASLFPGNLVLEEESRWVVAVDAPSFFPPKNRITLTLPVINRSFAVFFLVSGAEKRKIVSLILEDPERARESYPAAMVHPKEKLVWYVGEDAYYG
jgi:6-phosphogluconolactonase